MGFKNKGIHRKGVVALEDSHLEAVWGETMRRWGVGWGLWGGSVKGEIVCFEAGRVNCYHF